MNRHRFIEIADIRITNPEQYLGCYKSGYEYFLAQSVEGFKKHDKKSGRSEDWVVLRGLSRPISGPGYAVPAAAPLNQIKHEFKKIDNGPTTWVTMRTV